jgi:hypothetical protein
MELSVNSGSFDVNTKASCRKSAFMFEMQRIEIVRLHFKHLPVRLLGFLGATRLVMCEPDVEPPLYRMRAIEVD